MVMHLGNTLMPRVERNWHQLAPCGTRIFLSELPYDSQKRNRDHGRKVMVHSSWPHDLTILALNSASIANSLRGKNKSINQSTQEESPRSWRTKHESHRFQRWLNKCVEQCHEDHRGDISFYGPLVTEQRRGPSRHRKVMGQAPACI